MAAVREHLLHTRHMMMGGTAPPTNTPMQVISQLMLMPATWTIVRATPMTTAAAKQVDQKDFLGHLHARLWLRRLQSRAERTCCKRTCPHHDT